MAQFIVSQRVGHDWATEQQQQDTPWTCPHGADYLMGKTGNPVNKGEMEIICTLK